MLFRGSTQNVFDSPCTPSQADNPFRVKASQPLGCQETRESVAAGADGVMIEMHPRPDEATAKATARRTLAALVVLGLTAKVAVTKQVFFL